MALNTAILTDTARAATDFVIADYCAGVYAHLAGDYSQHAQAAVYDQPYLSDTGAVVGNQSLRILAQVPTQGGTFVSAIIAVGSTWKYLDNGSDQGTAWRALGFNDTSWYSGPAKLGYGDGDEATVVRYGPDSNNKYVTTYFRRTFSVIDAASITNLALRMQRDDGVVMFLNGTEVFRDNVPSGPVLYNTWASRYLMDPEEKQWISGVLNPSVLVEGANIAAVEIHQANGASSDIGFNLELTATSVAAGGLQELALALPITAGTYSPLPGLPPLILTQPTGGTILERLSLGHHTQPFTMSVVATSTEDMTYQWQKLISGAASNLNGQTYYKIVFPNVISTTAGSYRCLVFNTYGSIASNWADLVYLTREQQRQHHHF